MLTRHGLSDRGEMGEAGGDVKREGDAGAGPGLLYPCNVLTPYPSPLAFIAATAATDAAAVVK